MKKCLYCDGELLKGTISYDFGYHMPSQSAGCIQNFQRLLKEAQATIAQMQPVVEAAIKLRGDIYNRVWGVALIEAVEAYNKAQAGKEANGDN